MEYQLVKCIVFVAVMKYVSIVVNHGEGDVSGRWRLSF